MGNWTPDVTFMGSSYPNAHAARVACVVTYVTANGNQPECDTVEFIRLSDEDILSEMSADGWSFPEGTEDHHAIAAIRDARDRIVCETGCD